MQEVKDKLRAFILSNYLPGESPDNLKDDTPLQTSGILDSLAALNVVNYIQQEFAVELDVHDTAAERFDRLDDIAAVVVRKRDVQ